MKELLDAVTGLVALVSPSRVAALAAAVRGRSFGQAGSLVRALVDTPAAREAVERVVEAWSRSGTSGDELSGLMLGATHYRSRAEQELSIELVWTGPTTAFVPTRRTEQVLLDVILQARRQLDLVSFVAYEVPSVTAALSQACSRGVQVRILLEAAREHGGTLEEDLLQSVRSGVPGAHFLTWKDRSGSFTDGKVHAKLAVADSAIAFVTSANLTGHAIEKNIEAGVLIRGGSVPRLLREHLDSLIDVGVLGPA
jgi:cardiolipin synthase